MVGRTKMMLIAQEVVSIGTICAARTPFTPGSFREKGGDVDISLAVDKFISTMFVTIMCQSS